MNAQNYLHCLPCFLVVHAMHVGIGGFCWRGTKVWDEEISSAASTNVPEWRLGEGQSKLGLFANLPQMQRDNQVLPCCHWWREKQRSIGFHWLLMVFENQCKVRHRGKFQLKRTWYQWSIIIMLLARFPWLWIVTKNPYNKKLAIEVLNRLNDRKRANVAVVACRIRKAKIASEVEIIHIWLLHFNKLTPPFRASKLAFSLSLSPNEESLSAEMVLFNAIKFLLLDYNETVVFQNASTSTLASSSWLVKWLTSSCREILSLIAPCFFSHQAFEICNWHLFLDRTVGCLGVSMRWWSWTNTANKYCNQYGARDIG